MAEWEGKSKGGETGYRIFVFILKNLGLGVAYFFLLFVAAYYVLFSAKSTKAIYAFYRNRMGYGTLQSVRKLYQNYYVFGQTLIDKVVIQSGMPNKFTCVSNGQESLHQIIKNQKGGIVISAHIGSWETAGHFLTDHEAVINILMHDVEHEKIKGYLSKVTGKKRVNVIPIKDDISHIYKISEALARNELICMHGDRYMKGSKYLEAEFLGEKACFPEGPFILAALFKVPVVYAFSFKTSKNQYHFYSTPIKDFSHISKRDVTPILNDFVQEVTGKIKQYPEHWFNYYDFWAK